jgi:hypothetical protein
MKRRRRFVNFQAGEMAGILISGLLPMFAGGLDKRR